MSTKMKGQSSLNPHAKPFIPGSKSFSPIIPCTQEIAKNQPKLNEAHADVANKYSLPDSIAVDFIESEEQRVVENISTMYPDIPLDFIIEFSGAHGYDFDFIVDMLEQFYETQDVIEMAESSQSQGEGGPPAVKETESSVEK